MVGMGGGCPSSPSSHCSPLLLRRAPPPKRQHLRPSRHHLLPIPLLQASVSSSPHLVGGSEAISVLGEVKDFLGEMAKGNEKLQLDAQLAVWTEASN